MTPESRDWSCETPDESETGVLDMFTPDAISFDEAILHLESCARLPLFFGVGGFHFTTNDSRSFSAASRVVPETTGGGALLKRSPATYSNSTPWPWTLDSRDGRSQHPT